MSCWTYIVGVIHIDTYEEVDDIKGYVEKSLLSAPKITGSERDVSVFVNPVAGHNIYTSCDCARCEYRETLHHSDAGFWCEAPEGYRCPSNEYQTCAVITVQGSLRNRLRKQTRKEWNKFHQYIAKTLGWQINEAICRVDGW